MISVEEFNCMSIVVRVIEQLSLIHLLYSHMLYKCTLDTGE